MQNSVEILEEFRKTWPLNRLRSMTIDEYTSIGSSDTFTQWLESRTESLGSIWGATSYKFGVYRRKNTEKGTTLPRYSTDGEYSWESKHGSTAAEAFSNVKAKIINVVDAVQSGSPLSTIEAIDLAPMVKWKIAFLYQDWDNQQIIPIYSDRALKYLAFNDQYSKNTVAEAYKVLLQKKPADRDLFTFGLSEWDRWVSSQPAIVGLVASDSNSWKKSYCDAMSTHKTAVIGWSKSPTGKKPVLDQLRRLIEQTGGFDFYIAEHGKISHYAHVIDFVVREHYDQEKHKWIAAYGFGDSVDSYTDKRNTQIVFVIDKFTAVENIITDKDFTYWGTTSRPTQDNLQPFVTIRKEVILIDPIVKDPSDIPMQSKNTIYYGPPGTGKTFKIINELSKKFTLNSVGKTKSQWLAEKAADIPWWKIIAFILLDIGQAGVPKIVQHPLVQAKLATSIKENVNARVWSNLQTHTFLDCKTVRYTKRFEPQLFRKTEDSLWSVDLKAVEANIPEIQDFLEEVKTHQDIETGEQKNYEFITFHQSMSYEDFIEGIKPVLSDSDGGDKILLYEIKDGLFKLMCDRARKDAIHPYAIFIDEINRGNVASIFGELITLIEDDKREGQTNAISITLPYSKEKFSVPNNLYIIGTMNSADRSVEALDSALRRRFSFIEMVPDYSELGVIDGVNLADLLKTINQRIEILRDRDHRIGHSYLLKIKDISELRLVFKDKIIPLLQEYFYGDWSKLAMVLGKNFVKDLDKKNTSWPKGFEDVAADMDRDIWEITPSDDWNVEAFISIYAK